MKARFDEMNTNQTEDNKTHKGQRRKEGETQQIYALFIPFLFPLSFQLSLTYTFGSLFDQHKSISNIQSSLYFRNYFLILIVLFWIRLDPVIEIIINGI